MRRVFLIILVLCNFFYACSNKRLLVKLKPSYSSKNVIRTTQNNDEFDNKPHLVLHNKDTLKRYINDNFKVFSSKCNFLNKSLSIGILIGLIDSNKIVVVPDSDFDNNYTNDTVYTILLSHSVSSRDEFINLFPIINISVKETIKNETLLHSLAFKVYPESNNVKFSFYSLEKNFSKIKTGSITFVVLKSYTTKKRLKGSDFFFSLKPNNYFFPLNSADSCFFDNRRYALTIIKKSRKNRDSVIFMSSRFGDDISYLNENNVIEIGKHKYSPDASISPPVVLLNRAEAVKTIKYPLVNHSINAKENKPDTFSFSKKSKFTLLHFTGSWCYPCKISLPVISKIHEKYSDIVEIISILKEKNISTAQKYLAENIITWRTFYEELDCTNTLCLDNKFNIQSYPSFLVIDEEGKLILRSNGNDGLSKIEGFFEEKNRNKNKQ